jgi:hypothetical protein
VAVGTPDFLHVFNNTSGTTPTHYGTQASGYVIQGGTDPTNYSWSQQSLSPTAGYLDVKTKTGGSIPYLTTAATGPGSALETLNMAIGTWVDDYDTAVGGSFIVGGAGGSQTTCRLRAIAPASTTSGKFDLELQTQTAGGFGYAPFTVATDLDLATLVKFAMSVEITGGNMQLRYKVNSNAVQTPAAQSGGADSYGNHWPALNVALQSGFSTYGGLDGRYYYFAFQRGGTFWSSTDLDDINTDPSAALGGWPSGGGGFSSLGRRALLGVGR